MTDLRNVSAEPTGPGVSVPRLLFGFLGAPVLWALHLSAVYFLLTLDCISAWDGGRWAVAAATVLFALGSGAAGWTARAMYRRLPAGKDPPPEDIEHRPSPRSDPSTGSAAGPEWTRFLLVLGMGGAVLFTGVIVLEGLAPFFADLCA